MGKLKAAAEFLSKAESDFVFVSRPLSTVFLVTASTMETGRDTALPFLFFLDI